MVPGFQFGVPSFQDQKKTMADHLVELLQFFKYQGKTKLFVRSGLHLKTHSQQSAMKSKVFFVAVCLFVCLLACLLVCMFFCLFVWFLCFASLTFFFCFWFVLFGLVVCLFVCRGRGHGCCCSSSCSCSCCCFCFCFCFCFNSVNDATASYRPQTTYL